MKKGRRYYYRDTFLSGSAELDRLNYVIGHPTAVVLSEQKHGNRATRREIARWQRRQSGGKGSVSDYLIETSNTPYRKDRDA